MWSSFLKEFLENVKNGDFGLFFIEKGHIFRPFSGSTKLRVAYVYIEESFDTICNMGYEGGRTPPPPHMGYGPGKSPMAERDKRE